MDLADIYISLNGFPASFAALSSLLGFCTLINVYKKVKKSEKPIFFSDEVFSKLSKNARKIIAISFHLIMMAILIFSSSYIMVNICGSKDIRIMPEGTYCYYVKATNEKGKTYTLPAKIYKYDRKTYAVENVYFKNGGYLYFGSCDNLEYNDVVYCDDQNDKSWDIELTNYKTTHKKVDETIPKLKFDDILRIIMASLHCLLIVLHIVYWKPKQECDT